MTHVRQLTSDEVLFVSGENPAVYFHVSGLAILDASDRPGFGFDDFRAHIESHLGPIPQFRWRLHEVPLGLDLPYWVEDDDFDLDHHVRRIAVPSPGDREALGELAAYLYCRHLDRRRPLWETWFIEGLADHRFAVFTKVHHCMLDGQAAAKMWEIISDFEPDAAPRPIAAEFAEAEPGQVPEAWQESFNAAWHMTEFPFRAGKEILGKLQSSFRMRGGDHDDADRPQPSHAPPTRFNGEITGERAFVYGAIPLDDVKAIKDHFGVTVNDVVLAVVGGSLRSYLERQGESPERSLRTQIAVSLRANGDNHLSNQVTTVTVTLATDLADPVERLRAIAADTDHAKVKARAGNKGPLEMAAILPAPFVAAMTAMTPGDLTWRIADANVIVSSVRGSPFPLYLGGARTMGLYPMSIITTGGALNVTCMSYDDAIDVGMTVEPNMVSDPWSIVDGLNDELQVYRDLLPKRRRRKRATG